MLYPLGSPKLGLKTLGIKWFIINIEIVAYNNLLKI